MDVAADTVGTRLDSTRLDSTRHGRRRFLRDVAVLKGNLRVRPGLGRIRQRVAELCSVLRFLYLQGVTPRPLGTAVPPVGGWRLAALPPPPMSAAEVQRLLDSLERSTAAGARNLAIITLIARLGLRSIEVARLELRDVDWRAGELVVRGKGTPAGSAPAAVRGRCGVGALPVPRGSSYGHDPGGQQLR